MGVDKTNLEQESDDKTPKYLDEFFDLAVDELQEMIEFLIAHRERLRDEEIDRLEQESQHLIEGLGDINRRKLLAEIQCFKEILALQRRLIEDNAGQHD